MGGSKRARDSAEVLQALAAVQSSLPVSRGIPSLVLAASMAAGCSPGSHANDQGAVRLHGQGRRCAGAEVLIEREVARIESTLVLGFVEPVEVFLDEVQERCLDAALPMDVVGTAAGCAIDGTTVAADVGAISHELVHAVRMQHGIEATPFFEEGVATVVGSQRPLGILVLELDATSTGTSIAEAAAKGWAEYELEDIQAGAHFTAWALDGYGADAMFVDFLATSFTPGDVDAVFQEATGMSLEEAEARWRAESAAVYTFSDRCDGVDVRALADAPITMQGAVACDDATTEAFDPSLMVGGRACFRLDAPAQVDLQLAAPGGQLLVQPVDCVGVAQASVAAGESRSVSLPACTWATVYATQDGEPSPFEYAVTLVD